MRTSALALLLALAAPAAQAQLIPSVDLGAAAGLNFARLGDISAADVDNSTGYHLGIYADVSAVLLSFRTGVYYLRAGDVEQTRTGETTSASFVTIPVDIRFQTPTPVVQAYLLGGPEARFPVGSAAEGVETRAVNLAANVGAGVRFATPVAGPSGFAEVRYSYDVTGFAEDIGLTTDNTYRLSVFMIRAGIGL
ncbi:MAG: outer membrane beta-barrel protein [Rubricoccaceae bacterium]